MPSFSIEAPGEANPLTESTLLQTLQAASSNDPHQIQTGTKQLQQWEKSPGFYKHLQSVFIARSLPVDVRYLAVIQLKNGIDKYWRKTATNAVSKDDKAVIRSRLISSGLEEPDQRLALQNALVIAKIARFEYPGDWPEAISTVIDAIRTSSQHNHSARLSRALLILLNIIKELGTGRLQRTRQTLQAATPEILSVLGTIYLERINQWLPALQNGQQNAGLLDFMRASLLSIKTLRRLLISGYEFPNRNEEVHDFWRLTLNQVDSYITLISRHSQFGLAPELTLLVEKHLLQLSKLHLEMAKTHPAAFVLLPNSLDLVRAYWGLIKQYAETFGSKQAVVSNGNERNGDSSTDDRPVLEKLSLKGLLLIRACIKMVFNPAQTFKYRHPQEKEEKIQAETAVKHNLLSGSFVEEIMNITVTKFFVIRESELHEWEEDPEDWENKEETESEGFEFSIRPCAEKLFLDVALYKDILVGPLLQVFANVATPENENILFKDSVYSAIGLAAAVIHDQLDFDNFLTTTLANEVQKQSPGYNILRRRIAILIGQWITIKIAPENRPLVFQIFDHLLNPNDRSNDLVVRVTAGRHLKNVADDWDFDASHFMPYADSIMTRLMKLIEEVDSTETKMALLNTISVLVERLEHNVAPFANRIVELLPPLWEQSAEEHLMKQAILAILSRLVNALKAQSAPFHSMLVPIIQGAVEPDSESQLYLLEDALDLWHAILTQAERPASPDVISLTTYLFPTFELGSESLRKSLEITTSYVLLAPEHALSDNVRKQLLSSFSSLYATVKPEYSGFLNNIIEIMIQSAQALGGEAAVHQITSDLIETRLLPQQLEGLNSAWTAHCTTGPNREVAAVDGVVETDYYSVLARLVLASPNMFLSALEASSSSPLEATLKWLLQEWFSHLDNIGDPGRRKLMALAITKLLETNNTVVLQNLQLLMTMWSDVITELREDVNGELMNVMADSLVFEDSEQLRQVEEGVLEAPEDIRRRELSFADPVHRIRLQEWVQKYLKMAIQNAGGEQAFQNEWLVNVDRVVIEAFGELGII
ncbi:hypothetical protein MBLNU457_5045t1 [Dothideomycetes sp. NU457]